jgi:hypothetical protein
MITGCMEDAKDYHRFLFDSEENLVGESFRYRASKVEIIHWKLLWGFFYASERVCDG